MSVVVMMDTHWTVMDLTVVVSWYIHVHQI